MKKLVGKIRRMPAAPFAVLSFTALVLFFWLGWFNLSSPGWRVRNDAFSDRLVYDTILTHPPVGRPGPWLGAYPTEPHPVLLEQQKTYAAMLLAGPQGYQPYYSQIGLQVWLAQPVMLASRCLQGVMKVVGVIHVLQLQTAVLNALVLTLVMLWLRRQLGTIATSLALGLTLLTQPWLAFYGTSVYWQLWSWLLPMAAMGLMCLRLPVRPGLRETVLLMALAAGTCALRVSMGYEFITTILVAMMLPLVNQGLGEILAMDAAIRRPLGLRWLAVCGAVALAGLGGIGLVMVGHIELLTQVFHGDVHAGLQTFLGVVGNRVTWLNSGPQPKEVFQVSLNAPLVPLLLKYLLAPLQTVPEIGWLLVFGWVSRHLWPQAQPTKRALILTTWVALLGPFSWFILAKGHAFYHTHLCPVLWELPFNLLGLGLVALVIEPDLKVRLKQAVAKL